MRIGTGVGRQLRDFEKVFAVPDSLDEHENEVER